MTTTIEEINFEEYGDIYLDDEFEFSAGQGSITLGQLSFTTDADLKQTRIKISNPKRPIIALIKDKK